MSNSTQVWLTAIGAFALGVVITIGAQFVSLPSPRSIASGSEWYSYVGGKRLAALVSSTDLTASPSWAPGSALPFRPEDAIARAKEALKDLSPEAAGWSFSEITLHEEECGRYFYTVSFRPKGSPLNMDGAQLLVYFNGKVTLPATSGNAP